MGSKILLAMLTAGMIGASFVAYSSNDEDRPIQVVQKESAATSAALKRMEEETPLPPSEAQGNRYCLSGPLGFGKCSVR